MTIEQLTRLIAKGESDRLEFKKSTGDLKGARETLCALLNGDGGRVARRIEPLTQPGTSSKDQGTARGQNGGLSTTKCSQNRTE